MDFGTPRSMSNPSQNDPAIAAKIYRDTNPEPDQHNYGQPIVPDIDDYGKQRSKFVTDCKKEQQASLQCIMDNSKEFFGDPGEIPRNLAGSFQDIAWGISKC